MSTDADMFYEKAVISNYESNDNGEEYIINLAKAADMNHSLAIKTYNRDFYALKTMNFIEYIDDMKSFDSKNGFMSLLLGDIYANGWYGVDININETMKYYELSADKNNFFGLCVLIRRYEGTYRFNDTKDIKKHIKYWIKFDKLYDVYSYNSPNYLKVYFSPNILGKSDPFGYIRTLLKEEDKNIKLKEQNESLRNKIQEFDQKIDLLNKC